ncbi:hypothetical protein A7982_13749 [Minicystis rosea]|nr:hypothetical protein A7982_13749 [Minicystis rosea]
MTDVVTKARTAIGGACAGIVVLAIGCAPSAPRAVAITISPSEPAPPAPALGPVPTTDAERCAAGNAVACNALAEQALAVPSQDLPRAHRLLRQSCEQLHDGHGCDALGDLYLSGLGVPEDRARALALFDTACERRYARACKRLGNLYIEGLVARDYRPDPRGAVYMRRACELDDAEACLYYGDFLQQGRGVARDRPKAIEYFHRACAKGDPQGCDAALGRR